VTVPRIDDQSCPPLDVRADRTVCSHADERGGIDVNASPTTVSPASEAVERITLRIDNRADSPLRFDGSRWRLYRNAGYGWRERQVSAGALGEHTIEPGETVSWSGIDAWLGLAPDDRANAGLYAAVLPTAVAGDRVVAAFLFRVVRK
jgi:hypothetical protein